MLRVGIIFIPFQHNAVKSIPQHLPRRKGNRRGRAYHHMHALISAR